jgi:hypothetical protein
VTESTLAAIEKLHAAWEGNVPLSATAIPDLIAEIRRLWKVRDAAQVVVDEAHWVDDGYGGKARDTSRIGQFAILTLDYELDAAKEAE